MAKVLYRSIAELPTGVYNVATDEFISLNDAINLVSKKGIPFPMFLAGHLNKILHIGHLNVPDYLIDYLKYSCLINNSQLKKYLGENFYRFKIEETIKLSSI
jgi:UDP-glucose 4-epimerase